jgi:hypothetical protein
VEDKNKIMTTEQFTYWLKGFMELNETTTLTEKQYQIVKDHLDLVFDKKTPNRDLGNLLGDISPWPNPNPKPSNLLC